MSKLKQAYNKYMSNDYYGAIVEYEKIQSKYDKDLFNVNIIKCINKLKNDNINIVYIMDKNFVMPTFVSIYSLIHNINKYIKCNIYILMHNVDIDLDPFKKLQTDNIKIIFKNICENFTEFQINKNGFHVSTAAVIKFKIPSILSKIDKVLYIDGDAIICKDICELYFIDIRDEYAAVIADMKPYKKYKPNILSKLNIESHIGYFNSGVMLLNLKKMRRDNIEKKLFDYRKNGINYFMDQDAFNVIFEDRVKFINIKYNLLVTLFDEFKLDEIKKYYNVKYKNVEMFIGEAVIIHFCSKNKPWNAGDAMFCYIFDRYFILSNAYLYFYNKYKLIDNIIVSITSFPKRINTVSQCIDSIINQSFKASRIILWLAKDEFPEGERALPIDLLKLKKDGLEIKWCDNIKSYKKLILSIMNFKSNIIITADDDVIYHKDWILELVMSYIRNKTFIHCHRAHRIKFDAKEGIYPYNKWDKSIKDAPPSYKNFATGVGGILYPPGSLYKDCLAENKFMKICPTGDDIWFWAMSILNGRKICPVSYSSFKLNFIDNTQDFSLYKENVNNNYNDVMIKKIIEHYPKIIKYID